MHPIEGPRYKIVALHYLKPNGCSDLDLYKKYAVVLDEKIALDIFWAKREYAKQIAFLEMIYKEKYVSSK